MGNNQGKGGEEALRRTLVTENSTSLMATCDGKIKYLPFES
jgi:hypothetical protein